MAGCAPCVQRQQQCSQDRPTAAACLGQDQSGYALRSRCDLVSEAGQPECFELVHADGTTEPLALNLDEACRLFLSAANAASTNGLVVRQKDLMLEPQDKLIELVRKSREKALRGEESSAEEG